MIAPTPPPDLVRELRAYDRLLRLRWGRHRQLWMIERALPARHPALAQERPNPLGQSPGARDLFEGACEGYVHVLSIHPTLLRWPVVREALRRADLHAHGGTAGLNRALDALQEAEDRSVDREVANFCETGAKDLHDRIAWADGRRVSLFDPPAPPLEAHEGFVVHDRRVKV